MDKERRLCVKGNMERVGEEWRARAKGKRQKELETLLTEKAVQDK